MRPLILSGGPAAGKTTCARALARDRDRAAFIDADDVRQFVVAGDATLWSGAEGESQLILAARNICSIGRNLLRAGFDLTVADFVTPESLECYRAELAACFVVHLRISLEGAWERAATRPTYLTESEFELLHELIAVPPDADVILDVDGLTLPEQLVAIREIWSAAPAR